MTTENHIPGFPGYTVTKTGAIRSLRRRNPVIKTQFADEYGYKYVTVSAPWAKNKNKTTRLQVHRAVLLGFGYADGCEKLQCDHINGIRDDNRIENLRWTTQKQNNLYALDRMYSLGKSPHQSKLTPDQVREIRKVYKCRCPTNGAIALSKKYGVAINTIRYAAIGERWKRIK